jgi:CubicO group peptidase (beta-lactamase class C family)
MPVMQDLYSRATKQVMKILFMVLSMLLVLQSFAPLPALAAPLPLQMSGGLQDAAELEAFTDGVLMALMQRDHVPGAAVAVVKDGSLFFSKGYGVADIENRIPVDPSSTLFRPGSVSKLFTWTAVMQLVEQDLISLDADVNTYIDFAIPDTFPEPVTMAHLMTHTAGFEDVLTDLFKIEHAAMPDFETYVKTRLPVRVFPPGQISAYSNYGTALAGYIVQHISGVPFETYVEQNILIPLGMKNSTFHQPVPQSLAQDMSKGYNYQGGRTILGGFEYVSAPPAGALSATAEDVARFMIAHLQNGQFNGNRILAEETAVQMQTQLFTPDPRFEGMAHGFFRTMTNEKLVISHGGDTFLFHANLFLLPEENVGVYISTNGTTGASTVEGFSNAFMDHYYPVDTASLVESPAGFQDRIQPFLGEYYLARSNFTSYERIITLLGPTRMSMSPEGTLQVNMGGAVRQYIELEPGLLQETLKPKNRLLYLAGEDGEHYLIPPIPFTFIKTPWYATTGFQSLLLGFSVLLFIGMLFGWPAAAIKNWKHRVRQPGLARAAHWIGFVASLIALVFLAWFIAIFSNNHPAYGVPGLLFQNPPGFDILMTLPTILAVFVAGMFVFTVLAWVKQWWSTGGRLFYTLLTLAALIFAWQLVYWNFLF